MIDVAQMPTTSFPTLNEINSLKEFNRLDGTNGINRASTQQPLINANNDLEAITAWLNEYKEEERTYIAYQKEAERLLLWCIFQHKKPLSDLNTDDFKIFFTFLSDPTPREIWCGRSGGRSHLRGGENWKPFAGPLSASSVNTSISIINSLISYLVDVNYLSHNPLKIIRKKKRRHMPSEHRQLEIKQRILEPDEWYAILDALESMPEATPHQIDDKMRLGFIIHMLYFLGLRISELTTHCWNAFRCEENRWWFYVVGKGNKLGKIPVNDELLESIKTFRRHLCFNSPYPQSNESIPLVPSWNSEKGLTARAVNHQLKRLAFRAAERFEEQTEKAERVRRFSAHWLRHLSASMQDRAGISFTHIRQNHRHAKDDTTRLYVHAYDAERHLDAQKLRLRDIKEQS